MRRLLRGGWFVGVTFGLLFTLFAFAGVAGAAGPTWSRFAPKTTSSWSPLLTPQHIDIDAYDNLYVAQPRHLLMFDSSGSLKKTWGDQYSTQNILTSPLGLTADAKGNVFVSDGGFSSSGAYFNGVRKFLPTGATSVFWEKSTTAFDSYMPYALSADSQGNIYALVAGNNIMKLTPQGKPVDAWVAAANDVLQGSDIAADAQGNTFIASEDAHTVQKRDTSGALVTSWGVRVRHRRLRALAVDVSVKGDVFVLGGTDQKTNPERYVITYSPSGDMLASWKVDASEAFGDLAVDSGGNVYLSAREAGAVTKFSSTGEQLKTIRSSGTKEGLFNSPTKSALDSKGNVYVSDTNNHRIQKFSPTGEFIGVIGSKGSEPGQLLYPRGMAIDKDGVLYVVDSKNNRIQLLGADGRPDTYPGISTGGQDPYLPKSVAVDGEGSVYTLSEEGVVRKYRRGETSFIHDKSWDICNYDIEAIMVDKQNNLYASDRRKEAILKYSQTGVLQSTFSGPSSPPGAPTNGNGELLGVRDIAADDLGNVFVLHWDRVQKFSSTGKFIAAWRGGNLGAGAFCSPSSITLAGPNTVYVTDALSHSVHKGVLIDPIVKNVGNLSAKTIQTRYVCNGYDVKPEIVVADGSRVLESGVDYELVGHENNVVPGKASVMIRGTKDYRTRSAQDFGVVYDGSRAVDFIIVPPKEAIRSLSRSGAGKVKVKWAKVSADGYQIQRAANTKFTKGVKSCSVKKTAKNEKTLKGLKRKKYCYVRVRGYVLVDGTRCYGPWSSVKKIKVQ